MAATAGVSTPETDRRTGAMSAREQLVANYVPLVRSLCRRFRTSGEPQEDLYQIAMIGLLNAIEKFDPDRGTSFSSLAIPEILGAILNFLRDHGSLLKIPRTLRRNKLVVDRASDTLATSLRRWPSLCEVAEACQLSEEEVREANELGRTGDPRSLDESVDPLDPSDSVTLADCVGADDEGYELSIDRLTLATALDTLPPREKTILKLRFYRQLSQRQIAERIRISQMHVSRLERGALQKLRRVLRQGYGDSTSPDRRLVTFRRRHAAT